VRLLRSMNCIFKYNSLSLNFEVSIGKQKYFVRAFGGFYQHRIRLSGGIYSEQT